MTADRWLTAAYLLWLCFTGFAIGVMVGRAWMRRTIAERLYKMIREGDLIIPVEKRVVGK